MSNKKKPAAQQSPKDLPGNSASSRREALRRQQAAQEARQKRNSRVTIVSAIVAVLAIIAVVAVVVVNTTKANSLASANQITPPHSNADHTAITVDADKAKEGVPTVRVYQDYQCPYCKTIGEVMNTPLEQLASQGDIKLEYSTMTFLDQNMRNTSSTQAALAASCADVVGRYIEYHDAVYAGQPSTEGVGYTDEQLETDFPKAAGITGDNLTTFLSCYTGKQTEAFVKSVDDAGANANITSTPTYEVNGKKWDLSQLTDTSADEILKAIQQLAS